HTWLIIVKSFYVLEFVTITILIGCLIDLLNRTRQNFNNLIYCAIKTKLTFCYLLVFYKKSRRFPVIVTQLYNYLAHSSNLVPKHQFFLIFPSFFIPQFRQDTR